ncbi:unnamed protein product [Auanema sp. JU1783]|nr:unnamed protein product [Auanema sp. JU1783]
MLRAAVSSLISPSCESSQKLLLFSTPCATQTRGRRRTLTPPPWTPPVFEKGHTDLIDDANKALLKKVSELELDQNVKTSQLKAAECSAELSEIPSDTRRVGLLVRKIGMMPQWTNTGDRVLCTLLELADNHIVNTVSPDTWYRTSLIGKRKAFNREGPLWKVTVGAVDSPNGHFTNAYRQQFIRAGVPVKEHLGAFLVSNDAVPPVGTPLDIRHFTVGQFVTATGKSIDWGFQGGMHRWGMRGQPKRRTTKSHRRIGSVGSVGDARIWPGKRMPGHMGYEWVTVSGLKIIRMNFEKQVLYVKGSVPGEVGEILQLKDCLQSQKKLKHGPIPTWTPSLSAIPEETEEQVVENTEAFVPELFRFTSPSIVFTDADAKKSVGRDKTKAKIAKVKK